MLYQRKLDSNCDLNYTHAFTFTRLVIAQIPKTRQDSIGDAVDLIN